MHTYDTCNLNLLMRLFTMRSVSAAIVATATLVISNSFVVAAEIKAPSAVKAQTISMPSIADRTLKRSVFSVRATASSRLPVVVTSDTPTVCAVGGSKGNTVTLLAAGTCTLTATQAGNIRFSSADSVTRSFSAMRLGQSIRFAHIATHSLKYPEFSLRASASSGLPVSLATTTTTICTLGGPTGRTITLRSPGPCSVIATQLGNERYDPATSITQTFMVTQPSGTILCPDGSLHQQPFTCPTPPSDTILCADGSLHEQPFTCPTPPPRTGRIDGSYNHSCMVLADRTVRCWGENLSGQLGNGTNAGSNTPVAVTGLTEVTAISTGRGFSCALLANTTAKCWGDNYRGGLGDGTINASNTPVTVTGISGAIAVSAGMTHTCALLSDSTIKCWGDNNNGQLGDGTLTNSSTPVAVTGITGATAVSAGFNSTCALLMDNTIKCWGLGYYGGLGNGANADSSIPVTVVGITGAIQVSAGGGYSCALLADTTIRCWGANFSGTLGDGTKNSSNVPVSVSGIAGATAIATGDGSAHSCALLADTTVKCWGYNLYGELGSSDNVGIDVPVIAAPVVVAGLTGATAISTGDFHSCAVLANSAVKCWGRNDSGQLGDGTSTNSSSPVGLIGL